MLIAGFIFAGMRQHSYLNSAKALIEAYDGSEPFPVFLKKYFAANKKFGSTDRKQVAARCYNFYRLGKALRSVPVEERMITAAFLCEQAPNDFLHFHKPEWNEVITKPLAEKIAMAGFTAGDVFPWKEELSNGIDPIAFCSSFFIQPDLFLRIRPGKKDMVIQKLKDAGLSFEMKGEHCVALPNSSRLNEIIEMDREAIVQDMNSQQVLDPVKDPPCGIRYPLSVWDCCAASGGKSILVYDILGGEAELTVSDIRESILSNLKKRFSAAGIKNYHSFVADLETASLPAGQAGYQLIICDAPCSGSGTWSRTPEQLYFFKKEKIAAYAGRQKKIVSNAVAPLQHGGLFIYITCSVFKKENEEIAGFLEEKFHLQLLQMELLKGYDKKADSMFVALFQKP